MGVISYFTRYWTVPKEYQNAVFGSERTSKRAKRCAWRCTPERATPSPVRRTGACCTHSRPRMEELKKHLIPYTDERLQVCGVANLEIRCNKQEKTLPIMVIMRVGPSLIGCDLLSLSPLNWQIFGR